MIQRRDTFGRTARRTAATAVLLLVAASGTASAQGGGMYGGGTMGGTGWGLFGGAMGVFGLLVMGLLLAIPVYLVYVLVTRETRGTADQSLSVLRERYARGELSDDEFERRSERLEQTG